MEGPEGVIVGICVLASSSAGNATFIGTGSTRILIDAGLSCRDIQRRLAAIGETPDRLDAILITHEHSDHVAGLPVLLKRYRVPVFLTHLAAPTLEWNGVEPRIETFQAGAGFTIGDIRVDSFTIPHDSIDPVGFTFHVEGRKIGYVTDLGYIPDSIPVHLEGSDFLILESNHDLEMLKVGPYPWAVKQRVMGRRGHLSNDAVGEFVAAGLGAGTRTLVLAHLSEHNNHPALAHQAADLALRRRALPTQLVVAAPRRQTELFKL